MQNISFKSGQAAMLDVWISAERKIIQYPCFVKDTVAALDRILRVNVILADGTEILECAPECVHVN